MAFSLPQQVPQRAGDIYEVWDEEPEHYIVERRVTVETYVVPSHRAPVGRVYEAPYADAYLEDPYPYRRSYRPLPRSHHYVALPYDDRECTVKRRWRHAASLRKYAATEDSETKPSVG